MYVSFKKESDFYRALNGFQNLMALVIFHEDLIGNFM